jgi:hypothetical protein
MECPGYISAERYVALKGSPKYMVMYYMKDYTFSTPEFRRVASGSKPLEPYVSNRINITYKPIYEYVKK